MTTETIHAKLRWLIGLRVVVVTVFLGLFLALETGAYGRGASSLFSTLIIGTYGLTILYALALKWMRPTWGAGFAAIQTAGDVASITAVVAVTGGVAVLSRYVRSQMLEVIGSDYVRTARSKGLDEDAVLYRHALRNGLLPFVTMLGLLLPGLIGGSVIFETIFAWPGIGRLGYEAILGRDYPVVIALNFIAAALTVLGTLASDILYMIVDPRIRL